MTAIPAFKGFDPSDVNIVDFEPEPPQPLFRELPPADEYPVSRLGPTLSAATEAIHDITQAPIEICAQSVLAAATLAAQGHADVVLPHGAVRPLSCFFLTISASGERKSSADGEALRAVREQERALVVKIIQKSPRLDPAGMPGAPRGARKAGFYLSDLIH